MAVSTYLVLLYLLFVRQLVTVSTCSSGYFLSENKQCIACPEHCLDCDSEDNCLYCDKGYWGKVCERSCPNCMTGTSCEKTNGFCKEECTYGYSGLLCNQKCDDKCISCTRENLQNCSKCAPGRYQVPYCDNICSGCHEQNCDETGVCTLRCVDGFWGHRCERKCSQNCLYASCDRANGTCSFRCNNNSTGLQCNETNNNIRDKNSIPLIPIIVAVAVAVTVLVGVVIACLCRRRKKSHQNSQPAETTELLGVETAADQEKNGASKRADKLEPIKLYLQKEEGCRVIRENGVNLFDCLSNCTESLISLDEASGSTKEIKSLVSAETLQTNVETLLKNHAGGWKSVLPLLVDDFPLPKSDPNKREKTEYLEQIEETFRQITAECSARAYSKTYTKLLLYASATYINTPIYVISFDQKWHYFEPLFMSHKQPEKIPQYITMCVCLDNLFYKVESTNLNAPPPKATGIVGMYKKQIEDTPTLSISVPDELTKMPESSKIRICQSVGEDVTKECCVFLLETKLINEEEYTSLTTNRLEDFCRKITGSKGAFETFCKVLIKRRQKRILSPFIQNWSLFVTSCEYLSQYEALHILDSAIVERNVSMNIFRHACSLVEKEVNDTSSGTVSWYWLRKGGEWIKEWISSGRGVAEGKESAVNAMKEKIKLNKIEEIQKTMQATEVKISTGMENVEKLFKTTLNKNHKSAVGSLAVDSAFCIAHSTAAARLGTTVAAVSAAVLGPFSLVIDIASLSEAAHNKRKGEKTDAGEMLQSMIDIVEIKCKIFNNMLRGHVEDENKMF